MPPPFTSYTPAAGWEKAADHPISYPETLVLYRTGPAVSVPGDSESPAGRVRYSCLKEAARGEAFMQIQWCWVYEKGCGKREWSEQERSPDWFGGSLRGVGARV